MALTPTEEAQYALSFGVSRSDLSPEAQAEYDRLAPDYSRAQHTRREEDRRTQDELVRLLAGTVWFPDLGVAVREGNVYRHGVGRNGSSSPPLAYRERRGAGMQLLGALAGARAEVVAGKAGSRRSGGQRAGDAAALTLLLGPVGLLAAASRAGAGVAVVMFADGSSGPQILLRDKPSLTKAQLAAVQFNALAATPAGSPAAARDGIAPELERTAGRQLPGPEFTLVRMEELRDKLARALAAGEGERERDKIAKALRRLDARIAKMKSCRQSRIRRWRGVGHWQMRSTRSQASSRGSVNGSRLCARSSWGRWRMLRSGGRQSWPTLAGATPMSSLLMPRWLVTRSSWRKWTGWSSSITLPA